MKRRVFYCLFTIETGKKAILHFYTNIRIDIWSGNYNKLNSIYEQKRVLNEEIVQNDPWMVNLSDMDLHER